MPISKSWTRLAATLPHLLEQSEEGLAARLHGQFILGARGQIRDLKAIASKEMVLRHGHSPSQDAKRLAPEAVMGLTAEGRLPLSNPLVVV